MALKSKGEYFHGPGRVFAIHPGSGSVKKNWPAANFLRLADKIEKKGGRPYIILGEAEENIRKQWTAFPYPVTFGQDLAEIASFLVNCSGFVGNDSGITHLSAAVGIRTVALFGPTNPRVWGPRGRNVAVIGPAPEQQCIDSIRIDSVYNALTLS